MLTLPRKEYIPITMSLAMRRLERRVAATTEGTVEELDGRRTRRLHKQYGRRSVGLV